MRDLFISPRNNMLDNWIGAFEQAKIYASVDEVIMRENDAGIFWLHLDANCQPWLTATVEQILSGFVNAKIVVLANVPHQAEAAHALSEGAVGYCHAYSDATVLVQVKAVVSHGGIWLGQDLLQYLIATSRQLVSVQPAVVSSALERLSPRESEVAQQVSLGLSNKEIARKLDVTERTVKAHISACFERLGVKDRLQLALMLNGKSL